MKKTIDEATARKLCAGCVYRKDLNPRCMKCFVQVLGEWRALAREADDPAGAAAYPTTGSAGGPPFHLSHRLRAVPPSQETWEGKGEGEAEEQREKAPLPGSAGKGPGDRRRREA